VPSLTSLLFRNFSQLSSGPKISASWEATLRLSGREKKQTERERGKELSEKRKKMSEKRRKRQQVGMGCPCHPLLKVQEKKRGAKKITA